MTRPNHLEVPNGIFHVTSRGNGGAIVFHDDRDCRCFIAELRYVIVRHRWRCLSYCLMINHFHLIVQTPDANLSRGMQDLKGQYARQLNARRGERGSRFQPRVRPQLIQDGGYLLAAALYVAQNPVRAGMVRYPGDWPWSSFATRETFVDDQPILRLLNDDSAAASRLFSDLAHAINGPPPFDPSLPIVGDAAFVERHAPRTRPPRDVVKRAWEQARPSLDELSDGRSEAEFLEVARHTHRYTLVEIAEHLKCNERTIRRRLSGAETRRL